MKAKNERTTEKKAGRLGIKKNQIDLRSSNMKYFILEIGYLCLTVK